MVELIGDPCEPSVLRIPPVPAETGADIGGLLFLSGGKLIFSNGTKWETITSA